MVIFQSYLNLPEGTPMETSAWNSYIVMANWLHQAILCRWLPWNCETSAAEMEWLRLNWLFLWGHVSSLNPLQGAWNGLTHIPPCSHVQGAEIWAKTESWKS